MMRGQIRKVAQHVGNRRKAQANNRQRRQLKEIELEEPSVLASTQHVLAVYKPPGWHSTPSGNERNTDKCLHTNLVSQKLGGGPGQDVLLPLHRLDQPCGGVLLFGKTKLAATHISRAWKRGQVEKRYNCVVSSDLDRLTELSSPVENEPWHRLEGQVLKLSQESARQGRPTLIFPMSTNVPDAAMIKSTCSIDWRPAPLRRQIRQHAMLEIKCNQGTRHMVRALMSMAGTPLRGDLKYGTAEFPLPNESVALHASSIRLPDSVGQLLSKGGGAGKDSDRHPTHFVCTVPDTWKAFFGITGSRRRSPR